MNRTITKERAIEGLFCSATFSTCEKYRYYLTWAWDMHAPRLIALMLNPSTATHEVLDPTVAGVIARAKEWGYGGVIILNAFAYRATDPAEMKRQDDPVGPMNDYIITDTLIRSKRRKDLVVVGWGKHGALKDRDLHVAEMARSVGVQLHCLDTNQDGSPKHPLYIKRSMRPVPWPPGSTLRPDMQQVAHV